jgi:hypothetical protein
MGMIEGNKIAKNLNTIDAVYSGAHHTKCAMKTMIWSYATINNKEYQTINNVKQIHLVLWKGDKSCILSEKT